MRIYNMEYKVRDLEKEPQYDPRTEGNKKVADQLREAIKENFPGSKQKPHLTQSEKNPLHSGIVPENPLKPNPGSEQELLDKYEEAQKQAQKQAQRTEHIPRIPSVDEVTKSLSPHALNETAVERLIRKAEFLVFPGTTLMICCITLKNGFHIIGLSDCLVKQNFDEETSRVQAFEDAKMKLWEYAIFNYKQHIHLKKEGIE